MKLGSVVTAPYTLTTRGERSLVMIASSVAKLLKILSCAIAGMPSIGIFFKTTVSPWYSALYTEPNPPRAKGSFSTESRTSDETIPAIGSACPDDSNAVAVIAAVVCGT